MVPSLSGPRGIGSLENSESWILKSSMFIRRDFLGGKLPSLLSTYSHIQGLCGKCSMTVVGNCAEID